MLFTRLIIMGFKLFFEYFPDLEILWPANLAVPGKGQRRHSSSTESRCGGQKNEIKLDDFCASS